MRRVHRDGAQAEKLAVAELWRSRQETPSAEAMAGKPNILVIMGDDVPSSD